MQKIQRVPPLKMSKIFMHKVMKQVDRSDMENIERANQALANEKRKEYEHII